MQTQVIDGLYLRHTGGMEESLRFLVSLHETITQRCKGKDLWAGCMSFPVQRQEYFSYLTEQSQLRGVTHYQTYGCYTQLNHKSANLTTRDVFMKQLLCIRQLTAEKAAAIVEKFPTLLSLYRLYSSIPEERTREQHFKDWSVDGDPQRRFGPALSKRIYRLVHGRSYD